MKDIVETRWKEDLCMDYTLDDVIELMLSFLGITMVLCQCTEKTNKQTNIPCSCSWIMR